MTWKLTPAQKAKAQRNSKARSPWRTAPHCCTERAKQSRLALNATPKPARKDPRP